MENFTEKSQTPTILQKLYHLDLKSFIIKSFETLHPSQKFTDNWHIDLIIEYLNAIERKQVKRLLINMPPRSLKSFCISVAWPAWILGNFPRKKIIVASYSQALSNKHSLDSRVVTNSDWFKSYFKNFKILKGQNLKNKFSTSHHGFRFATSVGSTLTGEGADIIIVDDPQTPLQALSEKARMKCVNWYEQTLASRLNDKRNGVILLVMQRLHSLDLSGILLKKKIFRHLKLQAIAEEDELLQFNTFSYFRKAGEVLNANLDNLEILKISKQELGIYAFTAQYQQAPQTLTGNIIKLNWINRFEKAIDSIEVFQSWDLAIKVGDLNDYSVCTTWKIQNNNFYLIDVYRDKLEYPNLKMAIIRCYEKFNPLAVIIEDKASGQQLIQELKLSKINVIKFNPKYDKLTRFILVSPLFEAGKIHFPTYAPWLQDLEDELISFPSNAHDDQVDAISQFLIWIKNKKELEMHLRRV